ncbi:bifunctional DNA-formamidopyrimidine glycosylase/DNA-(apurinic or apyrimidinic site) lyase [Desulforamulus hydrothermalis]|uniref:Formamidopyrimidine-DNA glycosylase n=1 Tax=Desulforamulus hydrothermalis Lam5 = DSM 18033 TaxID=1121428 RepID=K8DXE3_9FIRM|nr:bifunctional DNA-formamidopyrimidine glycosylase/DNA-(apurinic or apyrimidinic site) lyase [Desulforamulus hydrothermalis]CCO07282.1 Formamidopyrimidine-DNA glycosylase [Desulforamulus hydrothermalis Lam5 = DSM 18033]SHG93103.1 DNA-(apurinic or apyrimidinic site) lyase [Desulforamulus hydrothermalis Lam5 = DSM 18033]
MPELPEVETVVRTLEEKLCGLVITDVELFKPEVIRFPKPDQFIEQITGKQFQKKLGRRGKYLLLHLSDHLTLVVHLRMTGRLVYCEADQPLIKHTHVIFRLSNGKHLRFADTRRFGRLLLTSTEEVYGLPGIRDLGPEPLDQEFTREFFKKELRRRRSRIKPLLLDQCFMAGLGNIYADEALFRAKIHPERLAPELSSREVANLHRAIVEVIASGIEHRGTSFRDYVDGEGQAGSYQHHLKVYNRAGLPCSRCGKPIERIKVAGRSSYYCPACQKPK